MQVQHPRQSRDCAGEWCSCHFRDSHLCTCAFLKRLSFSQPATWIVGIFFAPDVFCVKFYWMWLGTLGVVGPCFILGFSIFFLSKGRMGSFEATAHSCLRRPYFTCFRFIQVTVIFLKSACMGYISAFLYCLEKKNRHSIAHYSETNAATWRRAADRATVRECKVTTVTN